MRGRPRPAQGEPRLHPDVRIVQAGRRERRAAGHALPGRGRPDYVALAESFGAPGVRTTPETLAADLAGALATPGPSVMVLPALLRMFAPTHLDGTH